MPGLNEVPNEILFYIVDYITKEENPTQKRCILLSLLHVNRRFYEFALPLLYGEFSDEALTFPMTRQVRGWARTVIEDEGKASLVWRVSIAGQYDFWAGRWENIEADGRIFSKLTAEGEQQVRATIADAFRHDQDQQSKWLQKCLVDHETNSLLALAIVRLPNLRFLTMGCHVQKLWLATSILVHKLGAAKTLRQLDRLTVVSLRSEPSDDPRLLALAANWPIGRTLVGVKIGNKSSHWRDPSKTLPIMDFSSLKPGSRDLRTILLRPECDLLGDDLCRLIDTAKAPEVFHCHIGYTQSAIPSTKTNNIARALSMRKDSFKDITLHVSAPYGIHDGLNFGEFSELRRLEVCFYLFFGHEILLDLRRCLRDSWRSPSGAILARLPESLQVFSLVQCRSQESIQMTMVLFDSIERHGKERFRSLQELKIAVYTGPAIPYARAVVNTRAHVASDVKLTLLECRDHTQEGVVLGPLGQTVDEWEGILEGTFCEHPVDTLEPFNLSDYLLGTGTGTIGWR